MIRLLLALIFAAGAVSLTLPALAATPVKVTADSFVVDEAAGLATFTGNVVIIREGMTLWAPKVVVKYGKAGPQDIASFTASGGVRIKTRDQDARGQIATFDPDSQILKLSGNVEVTSATGTVNGPELVMDLAKNTTTFSSSKGGRVTGVFDTQ